MFKGKFLQLLAIHWITFARVQSLPNSFMTIIKQTNFVQVSMCIAIYLFRSIV